MKQPAFFNYRTASLTIRLFKLLARNYWLNCLFNDPRKVVKPGIYAAQVNVGCGGSLMSQKPLDGRCDVVHADVPLEEDCELAQMPQPFLERIGGHNLIGLLMVAVLHKFE